MSRTVKKAAFLTAGGLAPCLSSAVAALVEYYNEMSPDVELIGYINGYKGLLEGRSISFSREARQNIAALYTAGGSPLGNSRVKLTNVKDCVKRGLVKEGENPQKVAADQLVRDGVDVLHTIGGDDTNTAAADLAKFLKSNDYDLTVVGLPKTIDNDVIPIRQSLGAWTAAEQGARFFDNVVAENSANPRMLIIHEVMGRNCGWLTATTAVAYRKLLDGRTFLPEVGLTRGRVEVHGIYVPEMAFDVKAEAARLRKIMDNEDAVNLFISEGAGVSTIIAEMQERGEEVVLDAFGHPRLDKINSGAWFASQFAEMLGAEKVLVQKSGYFSRAAASNAADKELIRKCARLAVEGALRFESGVAGQDEERGDELRLIEFERIKGGKAFDIDAAWFADLLAAVGQPKGARVTVEH